MNNLVENTLKHNVDFSMLNACIQAKQQKYKKIVKVPRSGEKWLLMDHAILRFAIASLKSSIDKLIENTNDVKNAEVRKSKGFKKENERIDEIIEQLAASFKNKIVLERKDLARSNILSDKILDYFIKESPTKQKIDLEVFAVNLIIARFFSYYRKKEKPFNEIFRLIISESLVFELESLLFAVHECDLDKDLFLTERAISFKIAKLKI
jgi:hypothetical protein